TDDLFVGKTLLHGDVLMWLMKTLLTSGCTNQRGAGHGHFIFMEYITASLTKFKNDFEQLITGAPFDSLSAIVN
ncbi:hypothetical protein ACST8D_27005, partial [Klebsiella pneumoniae]|uniref:hypothetical protein n=1 Tax=Klebsiella pneumoniae TaxID=573 RepID=UPI003F91E754